MGSKKRSTHRAIEWVGGLASMPAYVTDEGAPYRPEMLVWMVANGPVVGFTADKPGQLLANAVAHLRATMERPSFGPAHTPARVRVASPELAGVLRAGLPPEIEVVCAPTPEIDHVLASMREKLAEGDEAEPSYLSNEIGADAVGALFHAAARLYRASPWAIVPSDESLFSVTIEQLGVHDAAMCVIGQLGESRGLILFSGLDDFEAYLAAATAADRESLPKLPPHFALNFERGADLAAALRKEIAQHRWEVASADAYPWPVAVDEGLVPRPLTADEVTIAEAISLALTDALADKGPLLAAWKNGPSFVRTFRVRTHAGEVEVMLRAPYEDEPTRARPPHDTLAELSELEGDGEEIDRQAREKLEEQIVRRFVESPEAKVLTDIQSCHFVMDFAADYFGVTIASLGPRELREIIFGIIPRKVNVDASKARWIIEENRAFFAFLKRELGLAQADACLRVLGEGAVKQLEAALSDRRNFGPAKALVAAGREAGFDVDTKEGLEAWMREISGKPLPAGISLPVGLTSRAVDPASQRTQKNKSKAARRARRGKR